MTSWSKTIGIVVDIRTIQADPNRKSLTIFNTHTSAKIYFKEGNSVAIVNGIPIYAKGFVGLTLRDDGSSVQEPYSFISDTAGTRIVIFEGH